MNPMKSVESKKGRWYHGTPEGKGAIGCILSMVLLGIAVLVGVKVGPPYYSFTSFQTDVKTEVSRAGAHCFDDDRVIKDILDLARRNEIKLTQENIRIERFAEKMFVTINYNVPVDFVVYQRDLDFEIKASSYIGRL